MRKEFRYALPANPRFSVILQIALGRDAVFDPPYEVHDFLCAHINMRVI